MNGIIIKKVTANDLGEIVSAVGKTYLPEYKAQNLSASTINDLITSNDIRHLTERIKGNYFFVAKDRKTKKVIGLIGLRKDKERPLHDRISTFIVLKEYQGKGIGSKLYKKILEIAKKFKVKQLVVKASLMAEPIYRHWGFKKMRIIEKTYPNGDIYRNIWMEKKL